MRIVKEIPHQSCRITIFSWNSKYLIKFEQGNSELTYKIDEMDILSEDDLNEILSESFIKETLHIFKTMAVNLGKATRNL